jgi:hypothetical protein
MAAVRRLSAAAASSAASGGGGGGGQAAGALLEPWRVYAGVPSGDDDNDSGGA